MLIGILQTGESPDVLREAQGDYPAMFERLLARPGFTFRTWRAMEMELPKDAHEADGWLITGSRHGAYEDLPFIKPLEAFIRAVHEAAVPMVGICFGHQIIAQALGGKVMKFPGGWAVGPQEYDFEGEKLRVNAWHQDQVVDLPKGARRIASGPNCENAALVYGDRMFTFQGHPEFGADFVIGLVDTRGKGVVPDALLAEARARASQPLDQARIADRIADFFTRART